MRYVNGTWQAVQEQLSSARVFCFIAFCLVLAMSGCNSMNRATNGDPLFGSPPPPKKALAEGPAPNSATVTVLPPPTAPLNGASTASLASGQRQFDPDKDLRIANPNPNATAGIQGWAGPTGNAPKPDTGATLQSPQPVTPATQRETVPVSNPGNAGVARPSTFEEAKQKLEARGVLWQRLEHVNENGDWKFACSVPNRQDPRRHRTYSAEAPDYLSAIQAVLDQIDKDP
jgi:hypothetical protein